MLLRLGITNYLSIEERQEFSFIASKLKDREEGLLAIPIKQGGLAVPIIILYGANASGKSNAIAAIRHMQSAIELSHAAGRRDGGIPRAPFALSPNSQMSPTVFDIDFVVNGVRYHYGYEFDDEEFLAEWLYSYPEGTKRVLFERGSSNKINFGASLTGAKRTLVPFMRKNSLFLSTAVQSNHEELSSIASFFDKLKFHRSISVESVSISTILDDGTVDPRTIAFLGGIGTGVVGHRVRDIVVGENVVQFQKSLIEIMKTNFGVPDTPLDAVESKRKEIELAHKSDVGEDVYFDIDRESAGTRRLLMLMNTVFNVLDTGGVMIIDELDASLHTQAAEAIVALFANEKTNNKGAQLFATTHDTNLMHSEFLRRDEIWFAQKDSRGATRIYPLSDIHTRQTDNIERGYLQGRFGAIPFSGSASGLLSRL